MFAGRHRDGPVIRTVCIDEIVAEVRINSAPEALVDGEGTNKNG